ncbi:MAG: nicotinate (nicotinamide) nucleotide adenylyltransferase, partial [Oscillospiraceae bacterium]
PTGKTPHKDNSKILDAHHRLNMTELLTIENPKFITSDFEVKNDDFSYTANTVESLNASYSGAKLYFIVGADSLCYMEKWYKPERIFENCTVCVANRDELSQYTLKQKIEKLESDFNCDIIKVDMPNIGISSTQIRKRVHDGKNIHYFTTTDVEEYIKNNALYL